MNIKRPAQAELGRGTPVSRYGREAHHHPSTYKIGLMANVRMDKWLWAGRFFKTRALAAKACELGRVTSNGQLAKSARPARVGDLWQVESEGGAVHVEVLLLSEIRGPAAVAHTLYRETEASRALRQQLAEERKA